MKLKQIGYKSRFVADIQQVVQRGDVVEVPKELGENLLKHNTDTLTVWEVAESKKNKDGDKK